MKEKEYSDTLPENAFRPLSEGEKYEPMMPAQASPMIRKSSFLPPTAAP